MMIGPVINGAAILIGGALGVALHRFIPQRMRDGLPPAFAMVSIAMGMTLVVKFTSFPRLRWRLFWGWGSASCCVLKPACRKGRY